jgi:hypothetical protein
MLEKIYRKYIAMATLGIIQCVMIPRPAAPSYHTIRDVHKRWSQNLLTPIRPENHSPADDPLDRIQ